jgi:hypothetical protein
MLAAWVRLPRPWVSVSRIRSGSTSNTVRARSKGVIAPADGRRGAARHAALRHGALRHGAPELPQFARPSPAAQHPTGRAAPLPSRPNPNASIGSSLVSCPGNIRAAR